MNVISDYHLHSSFSGDSETPMEDMIKKGILLGLKNMCFTEHMDMDFPCIRKEDAGMFELDTPSYLLGITALKEKYADKINVCIGVELGLQSHIADKLDAYVQDYTFDFIIGSSHLCNKKDPYFPYFYEGRSEEAAYREYFTSILDNLKAFHNFDVYGHLDYVVRYGPNQDKNYSYDTYRDILEPILTGLIDMGKGIEINTGGISYGLKELNPCTAIIKHYKELGGEIISIGSDAHTPERICHGFNRAADILKECGFTYYTIFENRIPKFLKL